MNHMENVFGLENIISNQSKKFEGKCAHGWPAHSPDFNPLDFFVWSHMKYAGMTKTKNATYVCSEEAKSVLKEVWAEIPQEKIYDSCVRGVKNKLRQCIAVGGGSTKNYSAKKHAHLLPE